MKTTAMFVEHVLIGGLFLTLMALLFPDWFSGWQAAGTFQSILFGTSALGAAYLIGIVYDRFADTLLEDQERRNQLRYAKRRVKHLLPESKNLFPIPKLRIKMLSAAPGITDHAGYLRTRIRLTRALASILPALALGFSINRLLTAPYIKVGNGYDNIEWTFCLRWTAVVILAAIYGGIFVWKVFRDDKFKSLTIWWDSDKTSDTYLEDIKNYLKKCWALKDPLYWGLGIITLFTIYPEWLRTGGWCWALPACSFVLTLLIGWAWKRIHKTYMRLMDNYNEYGYPHIS